MMKIKAAYLGGSRGDTGCAEETIEVPEQSSVADAIAIICEKHPSLNAHLGTARWALNFEFVDQEATLKAGDELALIPPVQGGAPRVLVTEDELNLQHAVKAVVDDTMGATVLFLGTVRNHNRGKEVESLHYEAYVPMVEKQLEKIIDKIEGAFADTRLFIAHRYGDLGIGDVSVLIAAASAHRAPAFDAAREAIEQIKVDVPIFKQEKTSDGDTWIGWGGG
jgi:MoaE-MoaD fusion protein